MKKLIYNKESTMKTLSVITFMIFSLDGFCFPKGEEYKYCIYPMDHKKCYEKVKRHCTVKTEESKKICLRVAGELWVKYYSLLGTNVKRLPVNMVDAICKLHTTADKVDPNCYWAARMLARLDADDALSRGSSRRNARDVAINTYNSYISWGVLIGKKVNPKLVEKILSPKGELNTRMAKDVNSIFK